MRFVNVEMKNSKYPYEEGWIKATYTLRSDRLLTDEEIKNIASSGKAMDYEFGTITQRGKKLVVFQRHNSRRSA